MAIVACSLGIGIVGGLALNVAPTGLVRSNWITYSLLITLTCYVIARARGAGYGKSSWRPADLPKPTWSAAVKVLGAAALVAGAVFVSVNSFNPEKTFTEVWLVPGGETHSPLGAQDAVLGIKSHEHSEEDFTVVVITGAWTTRRQVRLAPRQVWTEAFPLNGEHAEATVYRSGIADPYRTVWLDNR